ncbi:hypothetical protein RND71_043352 [Anisodus tanguticus]|uniref:Rab5 n=1 Tax=Anisodus tanguticus TaxID=243964 RepID=A0AAE1UU32_9SOLA|nr:hypothetical protein RND71_043352 [Anisodus tanguticus]
MKKSKLILELESRIQDNSNKRFTHGPVDGSIYAKVDKINFDLDTSINRPVNFNTENIYSNLNATSIDSGISSSLGEQNYQIINSINKQLPKNLNHNNKTETNENELIALNLNNKLNDLNQHFESNYSDQLDKELNSLIEKLNNQKNTSMPKTSEEAELDELLSDMLHELQTFPTNSSDTINRNKTRSSCKMYDESSSKQICGGGRSFDLESNQLCSPRFLKKPNYETENFSPNILNSNQATLGQPFSYGVVKASPALQRRRLHSEKTAYVCESEPDNLKPKLSYQDKRSEENLISLLKDQTRKDNYNAQVSSNSSIVTDGSVIAGQEDLDWLERQHLKLKNRKEGCFLKEKANKERILMQELRGAVLPKQALLKETDDDKFNQPLHIDTSNNLSPRLAYQQSRSQSANSYNNLDDSDTCRTVNTKKKTLQRDPQSGNNTPIRNLSPSPSIKKEPVHATNLTPTINDIRDKQVRGQSPIYDSISTPVANYKSIKSTTAPVSSTTMSSNILNQKNTIGYDDLAELIQTTSSPVYSSSRPVSRQSVQTPISKSTYYNTGHLYSQSTPIRNISDLPNCNNPPLANPRWSPISDDTTVKFEIWDTAGQERYHSLAPMYYRSSQAAVVVYDLTNKESFFRAKQWIEELKRQAPADIVIALAGNKADLNGKQVVETDVAQAYADENGLIFMETSAKTGTNVNDIFFAIAKQLPKNDQNASQNTSSGHGRRLDSYDNNQQNVCTKNLSSELVLPESSFGHVARAASSVV